MERGFEERKWKVELNYQIGFYFTQNIATTSLTDIHLTRTPQIDANSTQFWEFEDVKKSLKNVNSESDSNFNYHIHSSHTRFCLKRRSARLKNNVMIRTGVVWNSYLGIECGGEGTGSGDRKECQGNFSVFQGRNIIGRFRRIQMYYLTRF